MRGIDVNDSELDRYLVYTLCAREFGWKPWETDRVDNATLQYMMHINEVIVKAQTPKVK